MTTTSIKSTAVSRGWSESLESTASPLHVLLMDGNAPWVQSLFAAMPPEVTVSSFRPMGLASAMRRPLGWLREIRWRSTGTNWSERSFIVPSWSRAPRLTTAACAMHLGRRLASVSGDTIIVYNLPYYADLARRWPNVPRIYFAYDPYGCYADWNQSTVAAGEQELLTRCDAVFAISAALADDFRKLTDRPVFVQQNGVSESFLAAFDGPLPTPDDLPRGGPPIVGCVGQISRAYDWDLLDELVKDCPDLSFVFLGPVFDEGPAARSRVNRVLEAPNVRWLGPRPHEEIPRYIQRFDVCLNPLRVEPCNDRRSLLRLYDYLASDRPIVSTAIAGALEHRPHIDIGRTTSDLATLLRQGARSPITDRAARRAYIRQHVWERRAELFLTHLRTALARPTHPGKP